MDLCTDHFERLVKGDVCAQCPSNADNEEVVMAMAKVLESSSPQAVEKAVVSELRSIRAAIHSLSDRMDSYDAALRGNGKTPGLATRMALIEQRVEERRKNFAATGALVSAAISTIIALIALFAKLT